MNFPSYIVELLSGFAAGNIISSAFPGLDLGLGGNSVFGIIGGILGGQALLYFCATDDTASDMQFFLCSVAGGAIGGFLLTVLAGFINKIAARKR
ncbi:MAG TPA: hypothetical protein VN873_07025 [Candidatus Angelobacter sp.]|nr:hypothetical protein [Candidatus Angelobacter sp.]